MEGDAAIVKERHKKATDKTSSHTTMEREIAEQAVQLVRAGEVKSQAGRPMTVQLGTPAAAIVHRAGKGGTHQTARADTII